MNQKVLALSTPETVSGNINFAYVAAPEGTPVSRLETPARVSDLKLPKGTKVLAVCITGYEVPEIGDMLEDIKTNTNPRNGNVSFELQGASIKYGQVKQAMRLNYQMDVVAMVANMRKENVSFMDLYGAATAGVAAKPKTSRFGGESQAFKPATEPSVETPAPEAKGNKKDEISAGGN